MQLARAILIRNLDLEGFKPDEVRFKARLLSPRSTTKEGMLIGSIADKVHFSSRSGSGQLSSLHYNRERRRDELQQLPYLTAQECELRAKEFVALLGFPEELEIVRKSIRSQTAEFTMQFALIRGYRLDSTFSIKLGRYGGILESATAGPNYDISDLKAPKISREQAASIAMSEFERDGLFMVTELSTPVLMAGRPIPTDDAYRDRVSLERLKEIKADRPLGFWRVVFSDTDGVSLVHGFHVVDIDCGTGEVVGQIRMQQIGGGKERAVVSWARIGKVAVVGDRSGTTGAIEALSTKERPNGKPIAVQAGKLIYACRYDATNNILWRQLPGGRYEPGRPAPSLVEVLKAHAR